jgi:hypothetical protein
MQQQDLDARPSPLVIGGIGGSGTRAVLLLARGAGRYMGENLNEAGDALAFYEFADRWLGPYHATRVAERGFGDRAQLVADLHRCVDRHRAPADRGKPWGWKQPRSIYFLPLLHEELPQLRFIHVVRDGRDIALGPQAMGVLDRAERAVLPDEVRRDAPVPMRLIELWSRVNALAADYGESSMGPAYLRVRFEDLCRTPEVVIASICEFEQAALGRDAIARLAKQVRRPSSIGRWHKAERSLADALTEIGHPVLERFGYTERTRSPMASRWRSLLSRSV